MTVIWRSDRQDACETVEREQTLRTMPGRREVYAGRWNGRPVVVKVFYSWKARRHLRRELRGLEELRARGPAAPETLFYGRTDESGLALVTAMIEGAQNLRERLEATSGEVREEAAAAMVRYTAAMHRAGVIQRDLHAGNFLIVGETLTALDPAQMRFFEEMPTLRKRLENLAVLLASISGLDAACRRRLLRTYFTATGEPFGEVEQELFETLLEPRKRRLLEMLMRKTTRSCTRYVRVKTRHARGVFRRDVWDERAAKALAEGIEQTMAGGEPLKRGNTCTVCRVRVGGRDAVIKRYNHRGWGHSLRHTIQGTRALRCWRHEWRLIYSEIATAAPLGFVETMAGPVVRQSYLICEYVEGVSLREFMQQAGPAERTRMIEAVETLLGELGRLGISHHDLKLTNFIVRGGEPALIDLDSIRMHRSRAQAKRIGQKMLREFAARVRAAVEYAPPAGVVLRAGQR